MENQTVLVTGGAGFVGSHLCAALKKAGARRVISLDNYFTGSEENHIPGVEYRRGHTKDIGMRVPEKPDLIFHLGEYSRTEASVLEPSKVWELNVRGTHGVLEYCRTKKVRLIYAGSSTKFADDGTGRDQSPYAYSKAINTELVCNYGRWYGLSFGITYFYNVYGPGEIADGPYSTVIARFLEKYRRGEHLTVTLPGTQRRNFTHVDDIVAGLLLVGKHGVGDGYGLGAEESYSILDIAKLFGIPYVMTPARPGNRQSAVLDTARSRGLGWRATRSVEEYVLSSLGALGRFALTAAQKQV